MCFVFVDGGFYLVFIFLLLFVLGCLECLGCVMVELEVLLLFFGVVFGGVGVWVLGGCLLVLCGLVCVLNCFFEKVVYVWVLYDGWVFFCDYLVCYVLCSLLWVGVGGIGVGDFILDLGFGLGFG